MSATENTQSAAVNPQWMINFASMVKRRDNHLFVVSGNIYDYLSFRGYKFDNIEQFVQSLSQKTFDFCLQYNISNGPKLLKGDEEELVNLLGLSQNELSEEDREIAQSVDIGIELPCDSTELFPRLTNFFEKSNKKMFFVVQYTESLIDCEAGMSSDNARKISVTIKEWARSKKINNNGHVILLLTKHVEDLDSSILDRDLGIYQIRIPKPDLEARTVFIESLDVVGDELAVVSKATSGLSFKMIESIVNDNNGQSLTERVFKNKRRFLREDYGDVLNVMDTKWGFDCIGGLENQVGELKWVSEKMKLGEYDKVPMGILFTGPPGTGKTVAAEALAKEVGVNMVNFGNIRDKYVGNTDKFHQKFINACVDMAPVIIFVDEVDNALGRRDDPDGSGGVERRFMQKNMEVMSDTSLRGKLLWIGATNVPQSMDAAMLRPGRFSLRMCFFPPNKEERKTIFKAMFNKYPEIKTDIEDWDESAEATKGRNGADIESIIVEHAWIHADRMGRKVIIQEDIDWAIEDFIPQGLRKEQIQEMLLAGIRTCSSKSLIPDEYIHYLEDASKKEVGTQKKKKIIENSDLPDFSHLIQK